ncbi:MAG: Ig-like domain repeat protein [Lachnospiraceae bacterium]|nr:Ig-like domain repeat protein [Lachnospiraceae bacterium]
MKKILKKYPLIQITIKAFAKCFIAGLILSAGIFAALYLSGLYEQLERVLDLKYNSPFVLVPLYGFAVLAVLGFVTGILLYFYKYKRTQTKTTFYHTLSKRMTAVALVIFILAGDGSALYVKADDPSETPEITQISIEKKEADTIVNIRDDATYANGAVKITVEAVGTSEEQETKIYLGSEDLYEEKDAQAELGEDGKYYYTAEFEYSEWGKVALDAYAGNDSGTGEKSESVVLVLDGTGARITIGDIESDANGNSCEVTISDEDSGIAKIEYGWDLEQDGCDDEKNQESGHYCGFAGNDYTDTYIEYEFEASDFLEEYTFAPELIYDDAVWATDNRHTIYIRVTDHAGNVSCEKLQDTVGSDMLAPEITSVEIRKPESNLLDAVLRFLTFGTVSNHSVEIVVEASDHEAIANLYASGIADVFMNEQEMEQNEQGEYVLRVPEHYHLQIAQITVEDHAGWKTTVPITDILRLSGQIQSADVIVEEEEPVISLELSGAGHTDPEGKLWYGSADTDVELKITADDAAEGEASISSGLCEIKITDNGTTIWDKKDFSELEKRYETSFRIGELEEGSHTFLIAVQDNAGNEQEEEITFYIDRKPPESGTISVADSLGVSIDGVQWFDKEQTITFRVDTEDNDSGLSRILLNINGKTFEFSGDDLLSDENGNYVQADTAGVTWNARHQYVVKGTVTDYAGNTLELEPMIVYKDIENPVIDKFTVERKNTIWEKILNMLPYGAFSNDTLIFKAYVSDEAYDSGIDYVTIFYDGMTEPQKMKDRGNGVYSVEISVGEEIFARELTVTAYDRYGKRSIACPNLENAENGEAAGNRFVMIETIHPILTLDMPAGDSVARTDGQVWYNADRQITLKVQDENSGIRNIDLSVNGINIVSDQAGRTLLKKAVTSGSPARTTQELTYLFDTDYFTDMAGKAADGRYRIEIEVTDHAGNVSTCQTIYYIDDTAPQIDKIEFSPATADGWSDTSEFVEELSYGYYFKTDFRVTVNASDAAASSGLYELHYRFVPYPEGTEQEEVTGIQALSNGQAELTVPQGFKGQIYVEAFDNVRNRSGEKTTKAYVVDHTAPTIEIRQNVSTEMQDAVGNSLYTVDNSITVEVTDSISGIQEIGYSQQAELHPYERKAIVLDQEVYAVGDDLEDGWNVTAVEANLVTRVTKTFRFDADDNDICLTFDATDHALNRAEDTKSETFTVDQTIPVISVVFRSAENKEEYYNQNRIADITVIERNFDPALMDVMIVNEFGSVPDYTFTEKSATEHTAVIEFDEGDYTFDVTGKDLGNHEAIVSFSGGNENVFYVDKTPPVLEENFGTFSDGSTEDSFREDKTIEITVKEHNFDPEHVNFSILKKEAGAEHNTEELVDVTSELVGNIEWIGEEDDYTMSVILSEDAVYQVEIAPVDLAGNAADGRSTVVFEIDQTPPVIKEKNGLPVSPFDTETLDIYPYSRKDEETPSIEFEDLNIDHIDYTLIVYIPDHSGPNATMVEPVSVYAGEDAAKSGTVKGSRLTLPEFVQDGVYALEATAVDTAGNESVQNVNTYVRIVEQDVLAYIMDSNVQNKTGLYSFQYENGNAISKRPDNFEDIRIFAVAAKDSDVDIVLRDSNGGELKTDAEASVDESIYGMELFDFLLKGDFFKENFRNDTDEELFLSVRNEESRIDLGKLHIDNIAPTCAMPEDFRSWKWYPGEESRTITVSNISEPLDEGKCKVYDNGEEIAFHYTDEDGTMEFTLSEGWHDVGIVLSDVAGNTYNIQETSNVYIGYFWLWVICGSAAGTLGILLGVTLRLRKKRRLKLLQE